MSQATHLSKDYTRLRELLLEQECFPVKYLHKFIGKNSPQFDAALQAWRTQYPDAVCQSDRHSSNGGHRALTFVVPAQNVDQLIEMLKHTDQLADLVMVL